VYLAVSGGIDRLSNDGVIVWCDTRTDSLYIAEQRKVAWPLSCAPRAGMLSGMVPVQQLLMASVQLTAGGAYAAKKGMNWLVVTDGNWIVNMMIGVGSCVSI